MKRLPKKKRSAKSLADFDLSDDSLDKIITDAHAARQNVNAYAPRNAAGLTFYFQMIVGFRAHLFENAKGWTQKCARGLEVAEHTERKLRIGYVLVDDGTEHADGEPRSVRPRGPASIIAIARNMQLCLKYPDEYLAAKTTDAPKNEDDPFETWFICVTRKEDGYDVELALPIEIDEKRFAGWVYRIPVGNFSLNSEPNLPANDAVPKQDKPMLKRKKG